MPELLKLSIENKQPFFLSLYGRTNLVADGLSKLPDFFITSGRVLFLNGFNGFSDHPPVILTVSPTAKTPKTTYEYLYIH